MTGTLDDLVPQVRPQFEKLISIAQQLGLQPKIRSVGRTCQEQQWQKDHGYSKAGLCQSLHIIGHAVDLDLKPSVCDSYRKLGEIWEQMGGFWGGRWTQYGACGDSGHYHFFPGYQATPGSICTATANGSLSECEKARLAYLQSRISEAKFQTAGVAFSVVVFAASVLAGYRLLRQ